MSSQIEAWLTLNTWHCERLHARVTEPACRAYAARHPDVCRGCQGLVSKLPNRSTEVKDMSGRRGKCIKCDRDNLTIKAAGMCGRCHDRAIKAGEYTQRRRAEKSKSPVNRTGTLPASDKDRPAPCPTSNAPGMVWPEGPRPMTPRTARINRKPSIPFITVVFDARDAELHQWLLDQSRANRRSPEDHVLFLLDTLREA